MATKHLIKRALKHPELFTEEELQYFRLVKKHKKEQKAKKKRQQSDYLK